MRAAIRQTLTNSQKITLDNFFTTPLVTAHSLRRLTKRYSGALIRVRRSSDNTELDIGFDRLGNLNTSTLLSFVGNSNGLISALYDQSGNGRHYIQIDVLKQPSIVTASQLEIKNNRPAIYFASGKSLSIAAFLAFDLGLTFTGVAGVKINLGNNTPWNKTIGNFARPFDFYTALIFINGEGGNTPGMSRNLIKGILPEHGYAIWTTSASPVIVTSHYNQSSNLLNTAGLAYADSISKMYLATRDDDAVNFDGWISELITFNGVISNRERDVLATSQAKYYSIPLSS